MEEERTHENDMEDGRNNKSLVKILNSPLIITIGLIYVTSECFPSVTITQVNHRFDSHFTPIPKELSIRNRKAEAHNYSVCRTGT